MKRCLAHVAIIWCYLISQAVRIGDLELFKSVAEKFSSTFSSDRTNNLIVRLRHNVIRTGLRNISISYSRISLADVAKKLRLDSANPVADAESIVSKAIRDGAIDATVDRSLSFFILHFPLDSTFNWVLISFPEKKKNCNVTGLCSMSTSFIGLYESRVDMED